MGVEVKILEIVKLPALSRERAGRYDRVVTVEAGPGVRFTVSVPDEAFNEQAVKAAIEQEIKLRGTLIGRVLTF